MDNQVIFRCMSFDALDTRLLHDILRLRSEVFVVEQQSLYQDIDGLDMEAWHLCALQGNKLMGYARLLPPGTKHPEESAIGRVVMAQSGRGHGLGRRLMREALNEAGRIWPGTPVRIEAQAYLHEFYADCGFVRISEPFLMDGILHVEMRLTR